jgi:hypothetical protein
MVSFDGSFIHSYMILEEEKMSLHPINENLNSQETPNTVDPCSSSSYDRLRSRKTTLKEAGASSRME